MTSHTAAQHLTCYLGHSRHTRPMDRVSNQPLTDGHFGIGVSGLKQASVRPGTRPLIRAANAPGYSKPLNCDH
jgi:hypothetical protein